MRKIAAAAIAALLALTACSSGDPSAPTTVATEGGTPGGHDAHHGSVKGKDDHGRSGKSGKKHGTTGSQEKESEGQDHSSRHTGGSGGGGTGGSTTDDSGAIYPAAGNYTYAQQGYEEFCDASNCDKDDLPASQPVAVTYERRDSDSAVVVAEQRASHSRVMRTTASFDKNHSLITKVYVHFDYRGVEFDNTYEPDPPVEALRFPFESGAKWSGSWDAQTSGSYRVAVGTQETVATGAGNVRAFKIVTDTEFHGQFEGRSRLNVWIDPQTQAIVKTDGVLNVTSAFGRYSTVFHTQLQNGPGY